MLELFRLEAESQTSVLSAGVLAVESPDRSPRLVESLMRAAHSLKGAARIVGLDPAVRVAHALEDCFVAAGVGTLRVGPEHVDALLEGIDFLSAIAAADDALAPDGPWGRRADAVVARLTSLGSTPAPAPALVPAAAPSPRMPDTVVAIPGHAVALPPDPVTIPASETMLEPVDRVVRVSADSLTRLVGLAGESLVETRQLRPFVDSLLSLRASQVDLCDTVAALEDRVTVDRSGPASPLPAMVERLRARCEETLVAINRHLEDFESFARRNEDLSGRLHHEVIVSRMRPLADGLRGIPRLVRDLSRTLGKQVRLEVRGEQTGVDRDILDKLEAPLTHLLRNALDHGIEPATERIAAGKPAAGTIVLEARHRAGMLQIVLSDDGRGVDIERLRSRAVERDLVARQVAERLSEAEILEFLFLPGFSTKEQVTELSGRGVGLDVVQSMVKGVGGTVRVASQPGRRTVFTLQLPITMSVIRALLVDIGGEPYAFPLTRIDRILLCGHADVRTIEGRQYFDHDGGSIGLVVAAQILDVDGGEAPGDPMPVVVISDRGQRFGLVVNAILGERDLEVRPLDPRLGKVPDISSASLLENGDPVLIVDVEDLVLSIDNVLMGRRLSRLEFERIAQQTRRSKRILVVDDSITVRELERQLLQSRGFTVDVAVDGMDGWNAIRGGDYDLVVTDVDMPRMDGVGLVTLLKNDPLRRHIPVVIVSYKDREEDRLRGLDAGANRYLTKSSFHDETFLHTVIDLVGEPA
ncbi:MAG: hybrid sensor histidine kinase/response regulator [Planctomycetes bacterium]|nr:hybrid sensor histidine kinase/response regulator [Planctomycetota bacterium]